jgi:hypothetical protein
MVLLFSFFFFFSVELGRESKNEGNLEKNKKEFMKILKEKKLVGVQRD